MTPKLELKPGRIAVRAERRLDQRSDLGSRPRRESRGRLLEQRHAGERQARARAAQTEPSGLVRQSIHSHPATTRRRKSWELCVPCLFRSRFGNYIVDSLRRPWLWRRWHDRLATDEGGYGLAPTIIKTETSGKSLFQAVPSNRILSTCLKAAWIEPAYEGLVAKSGSLNIIHWPGRPKDTAPCPLGGSFASYPKSLSTARICRPNCPASSSNNFHATKTSPLGSLSLRKSRIAVLCSAVIWRGCRAAISRSKASCNSAARSLALAALSVALAVSAFAFAASFSNFAALSFASAAELVATAASNPASVARSVAMRISDCCFSIRDCCAELMPSSKTNRNIVQTASNTMPTTTSQNATRWTYGEYFWPSNIIPAPTATLAATLTDSSPTWGQSGSIVPDINALTYVSVAAMIGWMFAAIAAITMLAKSIFALTRQKRRKMDIGDIG